ncbi:RNA polymerase I-specific transcription initiation factor rrn11 [Chaetomidium leptoderma]|uniref:RNA polymerase I-specific transcription initiation factor rrn11 n=1 Tax=Chaetomidium leptoderma TaxID=669021 RepID=A0AAN6VS46_9PEZI|nr:RNA polymerase I-specific transcription initiation factor rrn11 [Chaetomidium leptoderma]
MDTPHRKRKRAASDAVINPLSHSPDTLKQFALAGYPADEPLPSKAHPGFPHRPPRSRSRSRGERGGGAQQKRRPSSIPEDEDDEDEDEDELDDHDESNPPRGGRRRRRGRGTAASDADIDTNGEDTGGGWRATNTTTDAETTDDDDDPETDTRHKKKDNTTTTDRRAHAYQTRVGWLTAVVRRCLAEGDVATAKRAFGLLARARVYGRKVDLRWERFWEMGAEILVREGEGEGGRHHHHHHHRRGGQEVLNGDGEGGDENEREEDGEEEEEEEAKKEADEEGKAESLARLKTYYEYLIQQYPFSKQNATISANSALDFHVALFSAEMEAAHAAHRRGLERLQRGGGGWEEEGDDDMDVDEPMDYHLDGRVEKRVVDDGGLLLLPESEDHHLGGLSRHELRLRGKENDLRLAAQRRMLDIAQRMDTVMELMPFSRDHELLRLRAMVALYVGDLYVPPAPRSKAEDRESKELRAGQRVKAKGFFRRIKEGGGELKDHDELLFESLPTDDEEDEDDGRGSVLPMFSSMGF